MDAADFKVFEAVARLGGMGRAAEALHTVQSNVTARIRRLEKELGTPLFRRHAWGSNPHLPATDCCPTHSERRGFWRKQGVRRWTTARLLDRSLSAR